MNRVKLTRVNQHTSFGAIIEKSDLDTKKVYKEIYQCSSSKENYLEVSEYAIGDARLRPAHSSKRIYTKIYDFCQERGYESVEVMNEIIWRLGS